MQKRINYSIFGKNDLLTSATPYDPRLTFDLTKSIEGLKLMYMNEFYVQYYVLCFIFNTDELDHFWWKRSFDPCDPRGPQTFFFFFFFVAP